MTDTTEQKALARVHEVQAERGVPAARCITRVMTLGEAICRTIEELEAEKAARAADREQHEADKQWFSEAARKALPVIEKLSASMIAGVKKRAEVEAAIQALTPFIIAKPDPLVDAVAECDDGTWETKAEYAQRLRAAIEKRGGKIIFNEE